jgi:hypothetical protein
VGEVIVDLARVDRAALAHEREQPLRQAAARSCESTRLFDRGCISACSDRVTKP